MNLCKVCGRLALSGVLVMVLSCGLFKKDKPPAPIEPTRIVLQFEAGGDINPNLTGRASPLVVRVYQLSSYATFDKADFLSLYEADEQTLGGDLIEKQEFFLKPNEKRTFFFEASEEIRTVGVLGAFRNYQSGPCKAAASIQENKTNVIHVFISGTQVQIK